VRLVFLLNLEILESLYYQLNLVPLGILGCLQDLEDLEILWLLEIHLSSLRMIQR
jgi:hypothetical protein